MASDNEASCVSDPNFAVICSFLECFGKSCGINYPDIAKLQEMLEDAHEVPPQLVELHVKLLRKLRKTVSAEKWERSLVKFCHTYSNQDGWELERFGYKKARIAVKLRLLKVLLEAQFDLNTRFKLEVNKLAAEELRVQPLGRDKTGMSYWFQLDEECNMRVYREDLDEENWELVARDREGVVNLINSLSDGERGPIPVNEDSSNSLEISEKPIIDTGQVEESTSPDEEPRLENNVIANETTQSVNEASKMTNETVSAANAEPTSVEKNVNEGENADEEGDDEEEGNEEEDEEEEEEEEDDEVSNEDSSKANSDEEEEDEEEEEDDEEEDEEEESQEAMEIQNKSPQMVTSSRIVDNKVPPMMIHTKNTMVEKQPQPQQQHQQQRILWKTSEVPAVVNSSPIKKTTAPRLNLIEPTQPKSIETPVITSPLKVVNIQDLQNPVEERVPPRDDKYTIKPTFSFQSADLASVHAKYPIKPIDKLAANLSRIQSEKLEKPGAAKLLEKIAENLARSSSVAQAVLTNGEDEKVQDFLARSASEKSNITIVPSRSRGMDLSTSPRGWETANDHSRPMDYSGIDLSSRKVTKPTDVHSAAYRTQDFQHREMDLSTRKIVKPNLTSMPYDSRTVILRNHTTTMDLSKKQMYPGYEVPQAGPYHAGTRIPSKDEHRLPNYTILPDPSKIASMRMPSGALKRPLEHVDDAQQEIMKRIRAEGITLRGPIDKRASTMMNTHRREEIVGAAIEEPVMMVQGEGSGSDCDALNPIFSEAIEEPVIFFYGAGAGHECDTGNPGEDTDNNESNESKNEGCSDVTTSLSPSKILPSDGNVNDTSSDEAKSSHRFNANYSQSSDNVTATTDNCQSTVVSSVSPKGKFKPTLGVQVIARTSGSVGKKSSRWDVGRPEDRAECDSSIISSDEQHISTADQSIDPRDYHQKTDIDRLASNDKRQRVVEGKSESDDITSTSNQKFSASKIAECTSSIDDRDLVTEPDQVPSIQPDSSFINDTANVNECETGENQTFEAEHCDSSVATAVASSSIDHGDSVESTIEEESNLNDVKTDVTSRSQGDEKIDDDATPRFFFGPNCISYSPRNDESRASQVATTSVNSPDNAELGKNNNNRVVTIVDTRNSESLSASGDENIEARFKNVDIADDESNLDCTDKKENSPVESPMDSECRVQSSTSPRPKDQPDSDTVPKPMDLPTSQINEEKRTTVNVTRSVDVTDRIESSDVELPVQSQSDLNERMDSQSEKTKAESSISQVEPRPAELSINQGSKDEAVKTPDVGTSSSITVVESVMEVDALEKNDVKDGETTEVVPSIAITEAEESRAESINRTSDSNDQLPETTYEEAASSALQETPDDSTQTIETNEDEKTFENKELELSSDLDDKTKQSMESEDDSMVDSVEKVNKNTNNEVCNEDAQDGFSKSSEIVEETKETTESRSNIAEIHEPEHIVEERSEMSVELPEYSSGDSAAPSSSSLAANPSGEESMTSEICESSLHVAHSVPPRNEEESCGDKVTPAPIVDSNISKSPERITIESQKPSSSARLLDSMDAYTDDLSENPSSGDQDSNEAMVIDDRTSDSNESTREPIAENTGRSNEKLLNFKDTVSAEIQSSLEKSDDKNEATCSITVAGETAVVASETRTVAPLENIERPEQVKDQSCTDNDQSAPMDLKMDETADSKNNDDTEARVSSIAENREKEDSENQPEKSAIEEANSTVADTDDKSTTAGQSSLVPNYDCSDEDEVSDDVFEPEVSEIEDLTQRTEIEENPIQTVDEIAKPTEVTKVESSEFSDVKIEKDKHASELQNKVKPENNKEFSDDEFESEDSEETLPVNLGLTEKNIETEAVMPIDEKQKIPSERIESEEESRKSVEISTDGRKEIVEKSHDSSNEIVRASESKDLEVSEETKEVAIEKATMDESAISSNVSSAICVNPSNIERVNECHEVVSKDTSTEESLESSKLSTVESEKKIVESPKERTDEKSFEQIDESKEIERDPPAVVQNPKPESSIVHSVHESSHVALETSDKNQNPDESKSLPAETKEIAQSDNIKMQGVVSEHPVQPKTSEKIGTTNALQEETESSEGRDEKITMLKTLPCLDSKLSNEAVNYTSENLNVCHSVSNTPLPTTEEISNVTPLKNDSKKEASNKRLHGIFEVDDFPPTKSRPPNLDFAKDITSNRVNDENILLEDKKLPENTSAPSQIITAFASVAPVEDTIAPPILQSQIEPFDKLKNHEFKEIGENKEKPVLEVQAPTEQRSSEIQSVDIKCVDLESDDSMGMDNENMFDTPADDVDPLACTEDDLIKPTSVEESSVPKIGIRVKPVADLVYEGWKLDSPEPPIKSAATVSRKRRNSAHDSNSDDGTTKQDDEDVGEAGGKRMKLRGKRSPDMKLRRSVEESRPESASSEDEATKVESAHEVIEIKENDEEDEVVEVAKVRNERKPRGRPRGRRRRGNRSFPKAAVRPKVTENTSVEPTVVSPTVPATDATTTEVGQPESKKKRKKRKMVLGLEIGIDIAVPDSQGGTGTDEVPVRQSRRIAQLKIKEEADKRRIEEETMDEPRDKKDRDGTEKKKRKKQKPESEEEPVVVKEIEREVKSRKQRKKKKMSSSFNEAKPWQSSSGSSSDVEAQDEDEDEEIESEGSLLFKSDHEFSPESDLEKDEKSEPMRRARTAQKAQSDVEEAEDEYACQKCGKADHPEWILLCDTCDKGWHCSCLRPALMLIPEGDWFCPPCQHNVLVNKLRDSLKTFDQNSKKHENEVLRKKRLAFVGISLDNVLHKSEQAASSRGSSRGSDNDSSSSSSESSSSSSSSDESEPVYQLRERRCANTYKFNEYDDMINAAIQDEVEAVRGAGNQGRGKDIATIVNAEKEEAQAEALKNSQLDEDDDDEEMKKSGKESDEDYKVDKDDADEDEEDQGRPKLAKKMLSRKKHRKLNSLDISSEDDPDSDEDFKGSSSDEEEDFEDQLDSSDDSFARSRRRGRKGEARPVRRSTRAARTRYDADFIDDDSDDSDRPKRKKSRSVWEGSESEDSDNSWRQRKKKSKTMPAPRFRVTSKTKSRKKKKRKRIIESDNLSDNEETAEVKNEDESQNVEGQLENETTKEDTENNETAATDGNSEEKLQDKETNCETSLAEDEQQKKKKKETTPKQKKAPGIRRKIVYGGLDDGPSKEEEILARRTRGRKINYQDIMGSDSEEELKKVLRKTEESEDEFLVNEGEEFNEDAEKDSDSGDIYSPKKDLPKGKAKSPKSKKIKKSKSPGGRKSLTDNGEPKQRKKPGPKPGSKNKPRDPLDMSISPIIKPNDTDSISRGMDMEGSTMSATGSVIGEVPEGSLTGLTPDDINALDEEQLEQMMMEDEEYGRRQLELAAIEIARNKKQEEREAKKLEKARLKALEILAAEQQRDPNAPEGTDGELPKKKKRGRRSKAEILAEQMRRDGVPSLITGGLLPTASVISDGTLNISPNVVVTTPTLPTVVAAAAVAVAVAGVETERSPDGGQLPLMAGPDGQLFNPDGSPMKPKRRGRGKGKKTLALEAARAAEAAAKAAGAVSADIGQLGITGTDSNPDVKTDDIPNVLPTPGSSTSGSAPPTPPATSQGLPPTQSPNQHQQQQQQQQQQQSVYPSLPPSQQSSVITRMLQSQPVSSTPQSFTAAAAAMGHKYFGGPNAAGQMMAGPRASSYDMSPRGRIPSPYRQTVPSPMPPHFAAVRSGTPPMRMRVSAPQLYHTPHHPMDPSPSGGGPISINSRDRSSPLGPVPAMIPPAAGSPLAKGGPTPPPPPYVRGGPAHSRFGDNPQMGPRHQIPQFPSPSPANHNMQQPSPPPNRPSGNFSPYHPPPPPNYHYGAYPPPPPMTTADDAAAYQGSPYSAEHFSSPSDSQPQIQPPPPPQPAGPTSQQQQQQQQQSHPNEPGQGNKQYDEEGTGEFGGLVSYFSSQREDDLDS